MGLNPKADIEPQNSSEANNCEGSAKFLINPEYKTVQPIQKIPYTITNLRPTNTDTTPIQHKSTKTNKIHKITDTNASPVQLQTQHDINSQNHNSPVEARKT